MTMPFQKRAGRLGFATNIAVLLMGLVAQRSDAQEAIVTPDLPAPQLRGQMVMRISEELLERLFARDIDKHTTVDRWVLGTHARGKAHTVGHADVDTEDSNDEAAFRVVIKGASHSRTVGHNGPAIIHTRTATHWEVVKQVRFDGERFTTSPGTISSNTKLTPMGVDSTLPGLRGRLVRRVGSRRVCECKSTAERINQKQTSEKILSQVDEIVDSRVEQLNQRIYTRPILKHLLPMLESPVVELSTNNKCIHIAFAGGDSQLATVCPLDRLDPSETELWIYLPLLGLPDAVLPDSMDNALDWLKQLMPNFKFPESDSPEPEALSSLAVKVIDDWIVLHSQSDESARESE